MAREITHQIKLEFYFVEKKNEIVIRSNITQIVVSHIFFFLCANKIEIYMDKL